MTTRLPEPEEPGGPPRSRMEDGGNFLGLQGLENLGVGELGNPDG